MMKKAYEKPELNIVSYTSNSTLCSGCDINDMEFILEIFEGWTITGDSFALTESCKDPIDYEGYCKFTSAETGFKVFTS